jgi:hypothetical protein
MLKAHRFPCKLPWHRADALNRESGRLYTLAIVESRGGRGGVLVGGEAVDASLSYLHPSILRARALLAMLIT